MADMDEEEYPQTRTGRETFLAVLLALIVGGGFALFLIVVTEGFFGWVIVTAVAISLFAVLHYYLWGRSLTNEVAEERRKYELEQEMEQLRAAKPPWERRF
jgi:ABC-type uncharacterized transport system permease subunit